MTPDLGYALDLQSPIRHVATELDKAAPAVLSIRDLAAGYEHPNPGDMSRIKQHEKCATDRAAKEWLMLKAAGELRRYLEIEDRDGIAYVGFRDGVGFDNLRYERKKLHRVRNDHALLRDPFNPMSGKFSDNLRRLTGHDRMEELRESMKAFGWIDQLPAIKDERGTVLVGHRRLLVAKELGIDPEPHTIKITLGDGDAADAKRFALAIASNLGGKPFTPDERKEIAVYLYGEREWTMEKVGKALAVDTKTISRDLQEFGIMPNSKRGRPRLESRLGVEYHSPMKMTPAERAAAKAAAAKVGQPFGSFIGEAIVAATERVEAALAEGAPADSICPRCGQALPGSGKR